MWALHLMRSRCYQQQMGFERKENKWSLFPQSKKQNKTKKSPTKTKPHKIQTNPNVSLREPVSYSSVSLSPEGFCSKLFLASPPPCTRSYSTVTSLTDIPHSLWTAWPKSAEGAAPLRKSMASETTYNSSRNNHQWDCAQCPGTAHQKVPLGK